MVTVKGRSILRDGKKVAEIGGQRENHPRFGPSGGYHFLDLSGKLLGDAEVYAYLKDAQREAVFLFADGGLYGTVGQ